MREQDPKERVGGAGGGDGRYYYSTVEENGVEDELVVRAVWPACSRIPIYTETVSPRKGFGNRIPSAGKL